MKRYELLVEGKPRSLELGDEMCRYNGREASVNLVDLGGGFFSVVCEGVQYAVRVAPLEGGRFNVIVEGATLTVEVRDRRRLSRQQAVASGAQEIRAPMPGKVLAVHAAVGDPVQRGQGLVVVEAMKMQNELSAPRSGRVTAVRVKPGDSVLAGATLLAIE